MSDSIGSVGSVNSVSSAASTSSVNNGAKAEVQYYNLKAIGLNRSVSSSDSASDVPLGAAVVAYAGDPSSASAAGTTRSSLAASSTPAPQVAAGNPFQAPPPAPAPVQSTAQPGNPWMAPPGSHSHVTASASSNVSSSSDTDTDEPKKPWQPEGNPSTYRDMDFDQHDDRPSDTWAPEANRSREFAALDNMKLTSPQEALAQWRAQKERAAMTSPATVQAAAPATSAPQTTAYAPPAAATHAAAPGNPWQAPHLAPSAPTVGLTMPSATSGPQLTAPPAGAQGFNSTAPSSPVDLSAGGYVNPNLSGPTAARISSPTASLPSPVFHPTNIQPNLPYLNQGDPGPQGMINQNRFQAMAANLNLGGVSGGNTLGLLGDDPDPESEEASYGMFGSLDGSDQKRNRQGPGASMLWQLGGGS